ncbi:MAG TPA: proton-conducting transporter membrane subunit [Thermoanaerobaculia bacterium]
MLPIVLLSIAGLCGAGLAALVAGRSDRVALAVGTAGSALACAFGVFASLKALVVGEQRSLRTVWPLPVGELHVALDALSSFFLLCVFLVSGLAAVYGGGYLRSSIGKRRLAPALFFFNLMVASMAVVSIARDGILFLVAWEIMSVTSYLLVTFESEREETRRAGMTYLIASQLGVVFLFVLFGLLSQHAGGTYDFDVLGAGGAAGLANVCFLLALVGFGTKAGFWPLHVWLPDAHPAAPSHVSALMSGVMIKMGIYGLLRTLGFLGRPQAWWGAALIGIGALSGLVGILNALAQRDLKRRLAYSSVENVGIIALGIGLGLLGLSQRSASVAFLGFAGALLHVLNHGLFKGLLFEAAGSVLRGTGTRDIDELGGLSRRLPVTAVTFLVGSIAICGLPPLNGFVSEWLLYIGAFRGGATLATGWAVWALAAVPALALVGGLAAMCFVSAFGGVFLGQARTEAASRAYEANGAMQAPMVAGALLCVAIGLWPTGVVRMVEPAVTLLAGTPGAVPYAGPLLAITRVAVVLLALVVLLGLLRQVLLRGREVSRAATWGCGYAQPSPRMQYTAASFAQPILALFAPVIHSRIEQQGPDGYFPVKAHYKERLGDVAGERILLPATRRVVRALSRLHAIQQGRLQVYLVYIAATLVALLIWQLAGMGR